MEFQSCMYCRCIENFKYELQYILLSIEAIRHTLCIFSLWIADTRAKISTGANLFNVAANGRNGSSVQTCA